MFVITGKDKGKSGKVLRALPKADRVIVEGVNVHKRHQKPRKSNQKGQIIDKTLPIHVSNVKLSKEKPKVAKKAPQPKADEPSAQVKKEKVAK